MRTTLDIDGDVLEAAKEIAARTRSTAGRVLSSHARRGLSAATAPCGGAAATLNGFEVVPAEGRVVTVEMVEKLMEESERP